MPKITTVRSLDISPILFLRHTLPKKGQLLEIRSVWQPGYTFVCFNHLVYTAFDADVSFIIFFNNPPIGVVMASLSEREIKSATSGPG